jgi:hypothetical protein
MNFLNAAALLLLLASLLGCAAEAQNPNTVRAAEEKPSQEQQQKFQFPSFTYRPGG